MDVLWIDPEFSETFWSFQHALKFMGKRAAQPPLGQMTVAALLPRAWHKRLVDTNVERLRGRDLALADGVLLSGMPIQRELLAAVLAAILAASVDRCRVRRLRTVVGGPIASSLSAAELKMDPVVISEAESWIGDLARDLNPALAALARRLEKMRRDAKKRMAADPRRERFRLRTSMPRNQEHR